MKDSASVEIDASPRQIWDVISDITRTGEWSPETFEARWTRGSSGPEVGAMFKGHVRRSGRGPVVYWSLCRVTDCVPGRSFGFDVLGPGDRVIINWRHDLSPTEAGSRVTQTYELQPSLATRAYWLVAGPIRRRYNRKNIRESLDRVKSIVESEI